MRLLLAGFVSVILFGCGSSGSGSNGPLDGGSGSGGSGAVGGSGGAGAVGGSGGSGGVCSTCAEQNAECGMVTNSCGQLVSCGDCAGNEECSGGQCVCVPQSCSQQGASCGKPGDGCGGPLDCGDPCVLPETCGGGSTPYTCGCTPTTCTKQGKNCGSMPDGCGGTLECGSCTSPNTCGGAGTPNVCGCLPAGLEGPLSPSQATNDPSVGSRNWASVTGVTADDTQYAEVSAMTSNQISNYLVASGFGFKVPSSATITGIQVEIKRKALSGVGLQDHTVSLVKSGSVLPTNKAVAGTWPSTETSVTYGGPGELWGASWTPADVNATSFGAALAVQYKSTAGNDWPRVNHVRVTVFFNALCN